MEFKSNFKVYYEDTDSGGVVYYANYLKFLERARTDAITSLNFSNKNLIDFGQEIRLETVKTHLKLSKEKITFVDHSFGHVAYAYCSGPLSDKNSYAISIDAFGDFVNYTAYLFKKSKILGNCDI